MADINEAITNDSLTKEKLKNFFENIKKTCKPNTDFEVIGSSKAIKKIKEAISDNINISFQEVDLNIFPFCDEDKVVIVPCDIKIKIKFLT